MSSEVRRFVVSALLTACYIILCLLSERPVIGMIFHLLTEGVSPCRLENGPICYNEIRRTTYCRYDKCLCSMIEVSPCPRNSPCSKQCGNGGSYACNCSSFGPCSHCFIGALLCSQIFHVSFLIWTHHLLVRYAIIIPSTRYLRSDKNNLWGRRWMLNTTGNSNTLAVYIERKRWLSVGESMNGWLLLQGRQDCKRLNENTMAWWDGEFVVFRERQGLNHVSASTGVSVRPSSSLCSSFSCNLKATTSSFLVSRNRR